METNLKGNGGSSSNVTRGAEAALNKASSGAHAAVDTIASAVDEAARKAKPAIDKGAAMAHKAVDKAADAAGQTVEWLNEQGDSLKASQKRLLADTCSYVAANPMKSVGIALVAGILISRIVR